MDKEAVGAAISSLEAWGRSIDNWVLICAAGVAIFLAAEVVFSVAHWLNEKKIRPLRVLQSEFHAKELIELGKSANEAKERAAKAELALERFKAPRALLPAQQADVASKMEAWATIPKSGLPQSVAVFAIDFSSFEESMLSNQIADALGPGGAKWSVNRNRVTYGMSYAVAGVGILTSSNPRGIAVAEALVNALHANGIAAFVIPEKRKGCEDIDSLKDKADTDPACSDISVMVGEKPPQ